ncbi:DUF92 domain-containing protein [Metabacillus sp. RGM 3146]|uniref:DUF92 domain-containing protein n=1 Tax=Metabacillus sp. RGM 3146 TaxID=3401092 RepID=UPI003B990F25
MMELNNGLAILFVLVISILGWRVKSLTLLGAIMSFVVGILIYIGTGFAGLFLLGAFFASSSLLSKYKRENKKEAEELLQKGDQRDAVQVLANGGFPAVFAILFFISQNEGFLYAFSVSIAAANSDTWASEIGTLSKQRPFMLPSLKRVERGTSGAVSLLGSSAALLGALFIAGLSFIMLQKSFSHFLFVALFGFAGNLLDTLMGGSIQVKYQCVTCGKITERPIHCGVKGKIAKGFAIFNNDMINALSIAAAAIISIIFYHFAFGLS